MIGRLVRPADFQRVLAAPQRSRSAHFAIHYLAGAPESVRATRMHADAGEVIPRPSPELSTGQAELVSEPVALVDDLHHWLGLVVPKRHAKRAVTRNLIKRQLRAAMVRHAARLPAGLWVVRLRSVFDRQQFPSPASDALRHCAQAEIDVLFDRAVRTPLAPQPPRPRSRG